jgi:hypothetical protein
MVAGALGALSLALSCSAFASTWDLADNFSLQTNPNGQWVFGSATTLGGAVTPFAATMQTYHYGIGGNLFYWRGTLCPPNTGSCYPQVGKIYGEEGQGRDASLAFNTSNLTMEMKQKVGGIIMHPSGSDAQKSVARWTAPKASTYFISASFYTVNTCGVSARVVITRNTTILYQNALAGTTNKFFATAETGVALNQGETIDFIVDNNGSFGCDNVGVEARIRTVDFRQ